MSILQINRLNLDTSFHYTSTLEYKNMFEKNCECVFEKRLKNEKIDWTHENQIVHECQFMSPDRVNMPICFKPRCI